MQGHSHRLPCSRRKQSLPPTYLDRSVLQAVLPVPQADAVLGSTVEVEGVGQHLQAQPVSDEAGGVPQDLQGWGGGQARSPDFTGEPLQQHPATLLLLLLLPHRT